MWWKNLFVRISLIMFLFSGGFALAACPSADLTGDCFVDFEDFALMANQWLTGDPCVPNDMVYIPGGEFNMGDHFAEGDSDELPLHAVLLDTFFMSRFVITNQQYCDYLNSALGSSSIYVTSGVVYGTGNNQGYCDTSASSSYSQIDYNDVSGTFSVRTKGAPPRDMSDDPMVSVCWYGAAAYCNWRSSEEGYESCYDLSTWDCNFSKHGYRVPTEAEWEYAGRGGLSGTRFAWADPNITHSQANYQALAGVWPYDANPTSGYHPTWNDGIFPYTSPAGSFAANGYGLYDMTGNVWELCNDWYDSNYYNVSPYDNPQGPASGSRRVIRGATWGDFAYFCRVANRADYSPESRGGSMAFRVVLSD